MKKALNDNKILRIFRYADDFLVLRTTANEIELTECRENTLGTFHEATPKLNFTYEISERKQFTFLDLNLTFNK